MNTEVAVMVGQIMHLAAVKYGNSCDTFAACVGKSFWSSFGRDEQSWLMQQVYSTLCDMGFTPSRITPMTNAP